MRIVNNLQSFRRTWERRLTLLKPTDNKVVADRIADALREAIFTSRLTPGEHLQEERLAAEARVSRGPVREALMKLEAEGLVVRELYRGARVATPSRRDMQELFAIRELLESLATQLATPYITADDIDRLRQLALEEAKVGEKNVPFDRQLSNEFHSVIRERCPNRRLQMLLVQLWARFPKAMRGLRPHRAAEHIDEYRAILDAVEAGDASLAGTLMGRHVKNGALSLLAIYEQHEHLLSGLSTTGALTPGEQGQEDVSHPRLPAKP